MMYLEFLGLSSLGVTPFLKGGVQSSGTTLSSVLVETTHVMAEGLGV